MKAVVSVIGKDKVGIISKVSSYLSELSINIEDISQTVLQDYFVMIMLVDVSAARGDLGALAAKLEARGTEIGVVIRIQHEDIFNAMHKI